MKPKQQSYPTGMGDRARTEAEEIKAPPEKTESVIREIGVQANQVGRILENILHQGHDTPEGVNK